MSDDEEENLCGILRCSPW